MSEIKGGIRTSSNSQRDNKRYVLERVVRVDADSASPDIVHTKLKGALFKNDLTALIFFRYHSKSFLLEFD